jgi:hypothetical protein
MMIVTKKFETNLKRHLSSIFCWQINEDEAMRNYLERYVQKKTEDSKEKETQATEVEKDDKVAKPSDVNEDAKPDLEHSNKEESNDSANKKSHDVATFGIVTDEDREVDRDALDKIKMMIEERLKTRPLPPPPPPPIGDGSVDSTSEQPTKTRGDSDVDTKKNGKGKTLWLLYLLSVQWFTEGVYSIVRLLFPLLFLKLIFLCFAFQIL